MLFNKEQLVLSLQEKVYTKIEQLRQDLAESLFEVITEETYFVFDKKAEDVVGGPFSTKAKANSFIKEMGDDNLIAMTEKAIESKFKTEEVSESSYEKDLDPNKKIVVKGVKGMKSTPFTKKFKNMAAFEKWADSEEASDYEVSQVMNESAPGLVSGEEPGLDLNRQFTKFKTTDEVINWFANAGYNGQKIDFDHKTGEMKIKGTVVAVKGKNGSYSVDITACGNVGLRMGGKEAGKNTSTFAANSL